MSKSYANRGQVLEELIIILNLRYRAQGKAVIHKVPTAWLPIRGGAGTIISAKVEEKAAVDFMGRYGAVPIAFDAKHTQDNGFAGTGLNHIRCNFLMIGRKMAEVSDLYW